MPNIVAISMGFIFRFYVMFWLLNVGLLSAQHNHIIIKILGTFFIFIFIYLSYNTFSKKLNSEIYFKWSQGLLGVLIFFTASVLGLFSEVGGIELDTFYSLSHFLLFPFY